MQLDELIHIHEALNAWGDAIFEQFVDLAEAGDADSMQSTSVNPNAVTVILRTLRDIVHSTNDPELKEELNNLNEEIVEFIRHGEKEGS